MARIRSIKPEYWRSEAITRLSRSARLTFVALWSYVDDNGVGIDNEKLIVAEILPLEEDMHEARRIVRDDLDELARESRVTRYHVAGKDFLFITGWDEHQKIDRPNKARYPRPDEDGVEVKPPTSENMGSRETLAQPSRDSHAAPSTGAVDQGSRGTGEDSLRSSGVSKTKPPTKRGTRIPADFEVTPAMVGWAHEKAPHVDGRLETEKFVNYWQAKSGRDATKLDWPATWRNWMLNAEERAPRSQSANGYQSQTDQNILAFVGRTGTEGPAAPAVLQLPRGEQ